MDGFLQHDEGKNFEAVGETDDPEYFGAGIAIGVRKDDNALRADLKRRAQSHQRKRRVKKVNDKYFKYDISGGTAK